MKKTSKCPSCGQTVKHRNPHVTRAVAAGFPPPLCAKCMRDEPAPKPAGQMVGELLY